MNESGIIESIQAGSGAIAGIFFAIVVLSVIIMKIRKKAFYKIPVKTTVARLIKTTDYMSDTTAQYAEQRQGYTVGKYEYSIDGKKYKIQLKTGYGGSLKDQITLYYRKGHQDISTNQNVTPSDRRSLLLVVYFAVICPVLAGAIWLLLKGALGGVLPK